MEAVRDGAMFGLRSPKTKEVVREVDARSLWQKILEIRLQTGEPYLIFSDTVNRAMPQHQRELGLKVRQSNLCSRDHAAHRQGPPGQGAHRGLLPVLASTPRPSWSGATTRRFIEDVMRFLDNVLQDFIDRAPAGDGAAPSTPPCASARWAWA